MKILHSEDNPLDAELARLELRKSWPECLIQRIDRRDDFVTQLSHDYDVILSDFNLVNFNGLEALRIAQKEAPDKPFIFLSGTIGEERALEALREGASDYVLKDRPKRLVPAIHRALRDVNLKREYANNQVQLERVQRLENLGMLAAGICHDFNNVLTPVLLGIGVLKHRVKVDPEADLRVLQSMESSAQHGSRLVKQLLSFTHANQGEAQIIQPKHLLRELVDMIEQSFPKEIQLVHKIETDLWAISINPTQLYQVVLNLCVNARDAMSAGGRMTLRAFNDPTSREVVILVNDTGTGIPREIIERIWEPFFTTKAEGKGTGLGLAIVKNIVEKHRGSLSLESRQGEGTTFRIAFPCADGQAELVLVEDRALPPARGETVLVAENDVNTRNSMVSLLLQHGYQVISTSDGADALVQFAPRHQEISAIITDCDMPYMDGVVLREVIRRIDPVVPILMVSGRDVNGLPEDAHFRILAKPFGGNGLLRAVGEMLQ